MIRPGPVNGFTLIEVVVAVAVIAIGLAATINTVSSVSHNTAVLNERIIATWVAQNALARHVLNLDNNEATDAQGEQRIAQIDWLWEKTLHPTEDQNIRRVDIKVTKQDVRASHIFAQISSLSVYFDAQDTQ